MKVEVEITETMEIAHGLCNEDSDCYECPCCIGVDDCIYNYVIEPEN